MKKIILGLLAGTALSAPGLAWAQEESGEGFDEIVITAQKREEALQDVPISVAAVSGESVENYGIDSLEDLSYSVPNLTVTRTGIANRLSIRGIATGDNKGFEQSVATFVDGIYYGRDQLSRLPLVDLERVEVLRGPQPTLFGNNAVAGAISVITRRPGDEFEASLQAHMRSSIKSVSSRGSSLPRLAAALVGEWLPTIATWKGSSRTRT